LFILIFLLIKIVGWTARRSGYNTEPTVKSKIIDLISATRTLLRSINIYIYIKTLIKNYYYIC